MCTSVVQPNIVWGGGLSINAYGVCAQKVATPPYNCQPHVPTTNPCEMVVMDLGDNSCI